MRHFCMVYISFQYHTKIFNLDTITNKNNKDDGKNWSYRMLIIGPSGLGKTNGLLNLIKKNKIMTALLTRLICMVKIKRTKISAFD